MGKVRKLRQKYHLSAKKSKSLSSLTEVGEQNVRSTPQGSKQISASKENIFAGIDISWDDINKSLPKDLDVRSTVSCKSRKELKEEERHLKKKEKRKLRHERFIQKLDVTHRLINNSKSKKKTKNKNKTKNLGGDMTSLLDALPSLQSLQSYEGSNLKKKCENRKTKPRGILKAKQRLKQQALDTKIFKHILDDKTFRENPLEAISQYLKQKISAEK